MTDAQMTYRKWADLLRHPIFEIDTSNAVTFANEEAFTAFGYTRDDLNQGLQALSMFVPEDRNRVEDSILRTLNGEKLGALEYTILRKDGTSFPAIVHGAAIIEEGHPISFTGSVIDITDRKQVEEELRESEEKLRTIFDNIRDEIAYMDEDGTIIDVNSGVESIFGYKREEVIGRNFAEIAFVDPANMQNVMKAFPKTINRGTNQLLEFETKHKDGNPIFLEVSVNLIRLESGEKRSLIIIRDTTERKRAEETLHRIQKAVESSNEAIGISDSQGNHFFQNKAFDELFGYTEEELAVIGGGPAVYTDHNIARDVFDTIMVGGSWAGEIEMISKDGRKFPVSLRADAVKDDDGEIIGLIGIHTDITKRKQAEAQLKDSEAQYRSIAETVIEGIYQVDAFGSYVFVNEAYARIMGYETEELMGKHYHMVIPEESIEAASKITEEARSGKTQEGEFVLKHKLGHGVPAHFSIVAWERQGHQNGFIGAIHDITDRKQADQALRDSEEKFRTVFENANDEIILVNNDGTVIDVNKDIVNGYSPDEFIGKSVAELGIFEPAQLQKINSLFQEAISEGKLFDVIELKAINKDGQTVNLEVSTSLIREEDEIQSALAIISDITERKQAEEKLQQQHDDIEIYTHELEAINAELRNTQEKLVESNMELQESEKRYRDLADLLPQTVFEADLEGNCTYANRHALESFGFNQEDIDKGLNALELFAPEDKEKAIESIARRLRREPFKGQEYSMITKNGNPMDVVLYTDLIVHDNETVGIRGIALDITERKQSEAQLKDSEAQYRSIAETVIEGIYQVDAFGSYVFVNEAYARIMGYETEELLGNHYHMVIPEESIEAATKITEETRSGKDQEGEFVLKHKLGHGVPAHFSMVAWERQGHHNGFIGTIHDITERKQAEEELKKHRDHLEDLVVERTAQLSQINKDLQVEIEQRKHAEEMLRHSEEYFRILIENSSDVTAVLDADATVRYIGSPIERVMDYDPGEVIGKSAFDYVHPDETKGAMELFTTGIQSTGFAAVIVTRLRRKDGVWRYVELTAQNLLDDPAINGVVINFHDIEEQKRAEEALKRSEEYFRILIENSSDMIVVLDTEANIRYASPSLKNVSGYDPAELIGKNGFKFVHPDEIKGAMELFATGVQSPDFAAVIVTRLQRKDGVWRHVELTGKNLLTDPAINGIVLNFHDIDERTRAEAAMRDSEEKFRTIFEDASDGIAFIDELGKILDINKRHESIWGYTRVESIGKDFREFGFVLPEDLDAIDGMFSEALEGDGMPILTEVKARRKDGSVICAELSGSIIQLGDRRAAVAITRDITERKQAEEALRESEEKFRTIFEEASDGITFLDEFGKIMDVNKRQVDAWGYSREELVGRDFAEFGFVLPEDLDDLAGLFVEALGSGGIPVMTEVKAIRKDGSIVYSELSGRAIQLGGQKTVVAITRDVTERKQSQEALAQSEEKLRLTFEAVADCIAIADMNLTIVDVNPKGCEMFGATSKEDLIGKCGRELVAQQEQERAFSELQTAREGQNELREYKLLRLDGTEFTAELYAGLLKHSSGNPIRLVVVIRDVTERKRIEKALRESELKFRTIFEQASDGIIFVDEDGMILDINKQAEDVWGNTREEVVGRNFVDFGFSLPENMDDIAEMFSRSLESGETSIVTEARGLSKDGHVIYTEISGAIIEVGGRKAAVAIARDITERRQAEEALRRSEESYRDLFQSTMEGLIVIDSATTETILINNAAVRLFGFDSPEDVIGLCPLEFIHPDDRDQVAAISASHLFGKDSPEIIEVRAVTKDGREIIVAASGTTIKRQGKEAFLISLWDITERKQAVQALRESEEKFNQTFRLNPNLISITSMKDGCIVDVNESYVQASGWTRDEIIGKTAVELGLLKYPEEAEGITTRLLEEGEVRNIELTAQSKLGKNIYGLYSAGTINIAGEPYLMAVTNDITERKQAEEALKASEQRFRSITENADDAITLIDAEGIILYVSPSLERIAGYQQEELIGVKFQDYMHPDDFPSVITNVAKIAGSLGAAESITMRLRRKDGSWCWVEGVGKNFLDDPSVQAIVCNYRDVTERIQAEEILRVADERWRALADNSPVYILSISPDGEILFINRPLGDRLVEDVIGSSCYDYLPVDDRERARDFIEDVFRTGRWDRNEPSMILPDGTRAWYEITAVPIMRNDEVVEAIYVANDISDRKRNQEQLQHYALELEQANSELSEYSQVVVHDIGTPLRAIRYHTRILRGISNDSSHEDRQTYIDTIDAAASECEELAQNLLGLSQLGRSELHIESINVGELLQKVIASSGISQDTDIMMEEKWPKINSDPVLLGHIFRNLIDNAVKFNDVSHKQVELKCKRSGKGQYEISVRDNGIGIDPQHQEEIFQVFRRLHHQDEYKGTGIGLSIVKKAAGRLGGSVRVESKLGEGSTFLVTIPKGQKAAK